MSALKYKLRDGWNILYGGILSRVLRKDRNLADLTNQTTARQNLGLNGDNNTTHFHDSRYIPLIDAAKDAAKTYADGLISALRATHNTDKNELSTRINSLTTNTNSKIQANTNNIAALDTSLRQYVDKKVNDLNTSLTNGKINPLQTEVQNLKNTVSSFNTNISRNTNNIAALQSQVATIPKIYVQSGAPSNPPANAIWFKTGSEPYISVYVGNQWVAMGAVWK